MNSHKKIGIISCVFQRIENLEYTMTQLKNQTFQDFRLYLVNNNIDMFNQVEGICSKFEFDFEIIHNLENTGPFARIETAFDNSFFHNHFMFLDDDMIFDETLLAQWNRKSNDGYLQGHKGFNFNNNYWDRNDVNGDNKECNYVLGQNLFISSKVFEDSLVLNIPSKKAKMFSDDLWLCYYVNHILGKKVYKRHIKNLDCKVDGKDTYVNYSLDKLVFFEKLKVLGWKV